MACLRAGSWSLTSRSAGRLLGLVVLVDGLEDSESLILTEAGWEGQTLVLNKECLKVEFVKNLFSTAHNASIHTHLLNG